MRAGAVVGGAPFVQAFGRGAYAYDREGTAYVDYVMAYGPLLFGHAHPALTRGLDAIAARGTVFGSTTDDELRLADRIAKHVPSMERLRFVSTGTEAMMSAVRVARAATGRTLVARFAGNYHGHFDGALHDAGASANASAISGDATRTGIPAGVRAESVVARYNDLANLEARIAGREDRLAAIVVEPIVGNMGLVEPAPGFLDALFACARRAGALVIFDEVITWLRLGLGGAQAHTGHVPDLTALGKAMGGGFPLAAFGGRADVMAALAPDGASFTGGTFSGNPFGIALGHRTLDLIESDLAIYDRLEANARRLADGIRAIFAGRGLPYAVTQRASMVDFAFRPGPPVRNYDERSQADEGLFAAYYHAMRERGVLLAPSPNELMFLSTEHREPEIAATLAAIDATFAEPPFSTIADVRENRRHAASADARGEACGMAVLTHDEITKRLADLPGWHHRGNALEKHFDRTDFKGSMRFVNAVADEANALDHHPDIAISWNDVGITLSSHDAGGLTDRDFTLATSIEKLAETGAG